MTSLQNEVDGLVTRLFDLVNFFGGDAPELEQCRKLYELMHACVEPGSVGLLSAAIHDAECEMRRRKQK